MEVGAGVHRDMTDRTLSEKCCGTCGWWKAQSAPYKGNLWGDCEWVGVIPVEWYIELTFSTSTGGVDCPCWKAKADVNV